MKHETTARSLKHETDEVLTEHFSLPEFVKSATAERNGLDNTPPPAAVENLQALCEFTLEPLRQELGLPLIITSGYRSRALNNLLAHHSDRSQHMEGRAADFHVDKGGRELLIKAFRLIIESPDIDYDQLILYPTFIHVSHVSPTANRHKLMLAFGNGRYKALTREATLSIN